MEPPILEQPILELELSHLDLRHEELRIRDRETQKRLLVAMERQGQLLPIVVVRSGGRDVVIDGFVRVRVLRRLGRDTVKALRLSLTESEALLFCFRQQQGRRPTALEEAWLVQELHVQGQSLAQIAEGLSRSVSWTSRRLGLTQALPESIQTLVRNGQLQPHAAMRTLVPLARANSETAARIAQIAKDEHLSSRQIERLCAGWRAGNGPQREKLLAQPRLYLKLDEDVSEQRQTLAVPSLVRDFETLIAIARRCSHVLRRSPQRTDVGATEALLVTWPRVCSALRELTHTVEESSHAEARHPSRDSHPPPTRTWDSSHRQSGQGLTEIRPEGASPGYAGPSPH